MTSVSVWAIAQYIIKKPVCEYSCFGPPGTNSREDPLKKHKCNMSCSISIYLTIYLCVYLYLSLPFYGFIQTASLICLQSGVISYYITIAR